MKVKFFISAVMLLVATSASAQFQTGSSSSAATASNEEDYNAIYFQYNPQTQKVDINGADDESGFKGIALGWKKGFKLMQSHPLFLEAGLAFQYTFYSDEASDVEHESQYTYGESIETKFNMGTLSVPLNLTYRYAIPNSTISIAPYAGLTLKGNLWAKQTQTFTEYSGKKVDSEEEKCDYFDKDDMGGSDNTANRLQVAWQIGVNVNFPKFYLGIGYGSDLGDFTKKCTFSTTYLTAGFNL